MPNPNSYEVGVNWNGDGSTFIDEIDNTLEFRTAYGRGNEFAPAEAGVANIILGNEKGRFTPERTAGPLFGDLEPGRRVRIKATQTPTTYDLFNGYITRIIPDPVAQMVTLECEDVSRHLRAFLLNLGISENVLSSDRVTAILDAVGITAGDRAISTGQATFPASYWRNTNAWVALQDIAYNELGGFIFVDPAGKVTFQDRHFRPKQPLAATLTRGAGFKMEYDRRDDQVYDAAILQAGGLVVGIAGSQVWSLFPIPHLLETGDTLKLSVNYLTPAKDAITPVSATDFVASANQDGTGGDRTSDLSTTAFNDFSGGAQWDLKNIGSLPLWIQKAQIRGTPLELPSHLNTVTRTATGSTAPFASTYAPTGFSLLTDLILLRAYAEYIANRYKTPQPLLRVTLEGATATLLTQMLIRKVSDRVKIVDTGPDWVSHVDAEFFIERVEHHMAVRDKGGSMLHETTWTMTSFVTEQFWILGTDKLGESTILGF